MEIVRIGVVGSGYMGSTYAETTARHNKGSRLVAIAGGRRAPALAAEYGVAFEPTVEALMNRQDIDAVILATPEQTRLEHTRLAAAAGKHVLSEKPMAPIVTDCDAMIAACRDAGVKLMVTQTGRHNRVISQAKQVIEEGRIGRIWMIRSIATADGAWYNNFAQQKPWLTDPAGGGFFYDLSVHVFDMMRWLSGQEPKQIFANVTTYSQLPWRAMSNMAQIQFSGGITAQYTMCLEAPGTTFPNTGNRCQIIGEKGLLDFDIFGYLDLGMDGKWERVWEQPTINWRDVHNPVRLAPHAAITQEFVSSILEERQPAIPGEEGRAAVAMCEACVVSARTGSVVNL